MPKLPPRSEVAEQLLIIVEMRNEQQHWREQAACRGMDPAGFFPQKSATYVAQVAKQICARCPVAEDCLRDLGHEDAGIVGGKTLRDRQQMGIKRKDFKHQVRRHVVYHSGDHQDIVAADLGIQPGSVKRERVRAKSKARKELSLAEGCNEVV